MRRAEEGTGGEEEARGGTDEGCHCGKRGWCEEVDLYNGQEEDLHRAASADCIDYSRCRLLNFFDAWKIECGGGT